MEAMNNLSRNSRNQEQAAKQPLQGKLWHPPIIPDQPFNAGANRLANRVQCGHEASRHSHAFACGIRNGLICAALGLSLLGVSWRLEFTRFPQPLACHRLTSTCVVLAGQCPKVGETFVLRLPAVTDRSDCSLIAMAVNCACVI